MNKYVDRRGSRRRDFDDDNAASTGRSEEPSYFQRALASSSPPVEAEVLWFNGDKGFGFVKATDGSEAFLHIRALEAAGRSSIAEGARLKVRIEQGQKGKQVAEVLEIGAEAAPGSVTKSPARPPARNSAPDGAEKEGLGSVKWYNSEKGFGFIGLDSGEKDVFVHVSILTRSRVATLTEGQRVLIIYVQGQKGPEARSILPIL
ncbi:cold-shock protein [Aureimonas glaciei]|uniref:Cold-shock protein n=1 Tax=Aureimonas glaciei TaxID=1776957 RepID=A0A916YAK5_9HYPH|nr:cold-shock protein [Aureimonas glaciei]GGD37925.1 cold-shock protein [Aureimonas glaciei]